MSFIQSVTNATYTPGYFLASADCTRRTVQIAATGAAVTTANDGTKYVKAGTIYPANDATAKGIVYEDVDVTTGVMPGSLVTGGRVYEGRLPATPASAAKTALGALGIVFETEPTVTRE